MHMHVWEFLRVSDACFAFSGFVMCIPITLENYPFCGQHISSSAHHVFYYSPSLKIVKHV